MYSLKKFKLLNIIKEGCKSVKILFLKKYLMINNIKKCSSDIIISTRDIHNKWLGKYGKKNILKIGWEHNHHHGNKKYIKKIIKSVQNLDYFVLVSHDLESFYKDKVRPICVYIPNIIEKPNIISNLKSNNLVTIGRLSPEKGYLDLIDIFKIIRDFYPDWKLNIIGDGIEFSKIKNKIEELGLENSIILHGFLNKNEINKVLANSSIYLMTSLTESFGIVLLEAMSFGIPCISFTSAEGANELISDNYNGYLIPDRDKDIMIKKIKYLIDNYDERCRLGRNGLLKIKEYSPSKIKDKWINILK